ncbi:MAG: hypothetical protein ACKVZJ_00480 [Phycisphaerales bacterium]
MESKNRAAREVAPEDIRRGDVVAVLRELDERVPFVCEDQYRTDTQIGTVRAWILPPYPRAYRVLALSLPFVYVVDDEGDKRLLDLRQVRLARLGGRVKCEAFPRKANRKKLSSKKAVAEAWP